MQLLKNTLWFAAVISLIERYPKNTLSKFGPPSSSGKKGEREREQKESQTVYSGTPSQSQKLKAYEKTTNSVSLSETSLSKKPNGW
jgi:hypothetical protein